MVPAIAWTRNEDLGTTKNERGAASDTSVRFLSMVVVQYRQRGRCWGHLEGVVEGVQRPERAAIGLPTVQTGHLVDGWKGRGSDQPCVPCSYNTIVQTVGRTK